MKITASSSDDLLQELAAWCELARDVLSSSLQTMEIPEVRTLKQLLLRRHTRHLTQLRESLGQRRAGSRSAHKRADAWAQMIAAMRSPSEQVASAACALLERTVLAAYERAADHIGQESEAMRLVLRHRFELECSADYRLPSRPKSRDHATNLVENLSALGDAVAVAS